MINQLFSRISEALDPKAEGRVDTADVERLTATLLVEIARTDHDIDAKERQAIKAAVAQASELPESELEALIDEALSEADKAVSLHDHVQLINAHFSKGGKVALVEQMWRVACADGNIDRYEEYTIRKLCDLLYVKHRDFMQAKLKVLGV